GLANVVLDQFEQLLSSFSLWRRRCPFRSAHSPRRAGNFGSTAFRFLSLARRGGAKLSQFPMGHPFARNRISRDFFRALAALAQGKSRIGDPGYSNFGGRVVSP